MPGRKFPSKLNRTHRHSSCFKGQRFTVLDEKHTRLRSMFVDPLFGTVKASISPSGVFQGTVEWKRPRELSEDPQFFPRKCTAEDLRKIVTGELSGNAFLLACSVLAMLPDMLDKVCPDSEYQNWKGRDYYTGIFHFQFFMCGEWIDVVIDDFLPTVDGTLICTRSDIPDTFWCSLLEKAYAKVKGSYEALMAENIQEVFVEFTGGVVHTIGLEGGQYADDLEAQEELHSLVANSLGTMGHTFVYAAISPQSASQRTNKTVQGFVRGRVYGITLVSEFTVLDSNALKGLAQGQGKLQVVRLQDPYGFPNIFRERLRSSTEIADADMEGSDSFAAVRILPSLMSKTKEFVSISNEERELFGMKLPTVSEFWTIWLELLQECTELHICYIVNLGEDWRQAEIAGSWYMTDKVNRAGGSIDYIETFFNNPQYIFALPKDDQVFIQMYQFKETSYGRRLLVDEEALSIGFTIIKAFENTRYRIHRMRSMLPILSSVPHQQNKMLTWDQHFTRGSFLIVPSTPLPEAYGEFLLRIIARTDIDFKELTLDCPSKPTLLCRRAGAKVTHVVVLRIRQAENLRNFLPGIDTMPLTIIVNCEGKKEAVPVIWHTRDPEWNLCFVFHRKKEDPISIQIFKDDSGAVPLAVGYVTTPSKAEHKVLHIPLVVPGIFKGRRATTMLSRSIPEEKGTALVVDVEADKNFLSV